MLIKSRVLLIGAASALALAACGPKDASKPASAPAASAAKPAADVAATVNGVAISTATVDMMVKERTAQGQPDTPELRKAIIDNLAMQTLVANEGVKKGMDKSDDVARQLMAATGKRVLLSYAQHKGVPGSCFGETEYYISGVQISQ